MKRLLILFLIMWGLQIATFAQSSVFNGTFICHETGLRMHLDLCNETIQVPGMSFLGDTHGYLDGKSNTNVYGTWMLIRHEVKGNKALLRFSNDTGSDSQDIVLTQINDSTFQYNATGGNSIRKVEGRKLVKIPSSMILYREK